MDDAETQLTSEDEFHLDPNRSNSSDSDGDSDNISTSALDQEPDATIEDDGLEEGDMKVVIDGTETTLSTWLKTLPSHIVSHDLLPRSQVD